MSVRGTKRQQIIAKWLRGEDDPDYEVIPTKDENKYIIKPKHSFKEQEQNEENETKKLKEEPEEYEPEEEPTTEPEEEERHFVPELREPTTEPDDEPKSSKNKAKDSEINLSERNMPEDFQSMILLELRAIREEQERKREEKMRKKEIKSITKKQLSKTLTQPIYDEEDHETPKPTRRRVNLLSRYVY